jgi:predicted amidohydrolase YtcJ
MAADLILTDGVVYTVDARRSRHAALAIARGRIVAVGGAEVVVEQRGPRTQVVDLGGRLVLPGFVDTHLHASHATCELFEVDLAHCHSLRDCLDAVDDFVATHPAVVVVRGYGWHPTRLPESEMTAALLDGVVADRPVCLVDDSEHSQWLNTAALRLVGLGQDSAAPEWCGAVIERLPDGTPSGLLREAWPWVDRALPDYDVEARLAGLRHFQRMIAARYGLTTVHEAGVYPGAPTVEAYRLLDERGELDVRCLLSLFLEPDRDIDEQVAAAVEERARCTGSLLRAAAVKLFADGVIESHTGYLAEPYADRPAFCGDPIWEPDQLVAVSVAAAAASFQLHYHAIGDAAVALSLDAIAAAGRASGAALRRDLITHLQLVDPRDYARMARLGVVAATQPYWFAKDADYDGDIYRPFLGEWRAAHQYPMRSLVEAGVAVAAASDYPVSPPPDPLLAIQRGVLRRDPLAPASSAELWPEEALTVEQMITAFTIAGAYANFFEDETGSLEVGKAADVVVLRENILDLPAESIHEAAVELTLFGGRPTFAAGPFAGMAAG